MDSGLLWFDDDPRRSLDEKVRRAAAYYAAKFGQPPTLCQVHPSLLVDGPDRVDQVRVVANRVVLMHHFWLGAGSTPWCHDPMGHDLPAEMAQTAEAAS